MSKWLVILGCSRRKRQTSRLIPAINRYDGPMFRVYRNHVDKADSNHLSPCVLSARFGLIPGDTLIPRYERPLSLKNDDGMREHVADRFRATVFELKPIKLFVSVGQNYWPLLEEPIRDSRLKEVTVAQGGIGGRASQLQHWLGSQPRVIPESPNELKAARSATLLGTTIRISRAEVITRARDGLALTPAAARRFETWYVKFDSDRVAPKWLVSLLFSKPVSQFRTADARRVLSSLGLEVINVCDR